MQVLIAAAIISLRSGSKATGNSRSFITGFLKSTTLLSTSPHSSPFWLFHGATQFSRTRVLNHCAIWPPSSRRVWRRTALRTSWCSGGLREPSLPPSSGLWLAGQPCSYPLDEREKAPSSAGLLGILVELTLKTKLWALTPTLCSEHFWERLLPLSVQSKFVCRLVQYLLFWVGGKWKTTLGGNPHPSVSQ